MTPNPYLRMAQNNAWANATLFAAIAGLDAEAFGAPRPGFFPSLAATLNHIHAVDLYYIDALEAGGRGRSVYERTEITKVAALARAQADLDQRFIALCAGLHETDLSQTRQTERNDATVHEEVGALILHLVQHQIHHRGQAHTMVWDAGIAPPQLDDFYLDYGRVPSAQAYFG